MIDLSKVKKSIGKPGFDLDRALNSHFKKYSFLGYREPFSKGYDLAFFKERLQEEKLTKQKPAFKIKLSKREKEWFDLMREMVFFRNYRTEKMHEAFYHLEPLWNKIGGYYGLAENELAHYQISEINVLLRKGIKVKKEIIKSRKIAHGYLVHNDKIRLITGPELKKKISKYNVAEGGVKEIKGLTACGGAAKGVVKAVMSSKEQAKVKQGEILVTSMTTSDFIPSMRRAAAFVTDEGGITCHATIVAREMKKPCIIGTKIATQILKDGDLVEVDADKGVVRILKYG